MQQQLLCLLTAAAAAAAADLADCVMRNGCHEAGTLWALERRAPRQDLQFPAAPVKVLVSCEASHPDFILWHDKSSHVSRGTPLTWYSRDMDYFSAIGNPQLLFHQIRGPSHAGWARGLSNLLVSAGGGGLRCR
jgi:hypothetical protein